MQVRVAVFLAVALLLPAAASAQQVVGSQQDEPQYSAVNAHPAECARLRRQIDHFTGMMLRAEAAENELWVERMGLHLERLQTQQAARCPNDIPVDTTGEAFKQLIKIAAKAAVAYFTFGAAGF
ncbi:MAG: hypothetical protein QNK04_10215 [Myxococcota bacterium]|nr:hypothetical protein [Myxococcota bacterium]